MIIDRPSRTTALLAGAVLFLLSGQAYAVVMAFEGTTATVAVPELPAAPYSEGGFDLTTTGTHGADGIFADGTPDQISNGSAYFAWCPYCDSPTQVITIARSGGGRFDFFGFDTAVLVVGDPNGELNIIGHEAGGGTVSTTVDFTSDWTTHALDYTNLVSLDFVVPGVEQTSASIDNLVLEVVASSAPEPASAALLLLGIAGLGLRRRRG